MWVSKDFSKMAIGMYNASVQKRGSSPQEAFENLVKKLHSMGVPLKDVKRIIGMSSQQLVDFDKAWIGQTESIYQALEKQPLTPQQISHIKKIISILYLRHLQEEEWRVRGDYVSYERLGMMAEDYSLPSLGILVNAYFVEYTEEDFTEYSKEIEDLIEEFKDTNPTIAQLEVFAENEGFLEIFIESPDRLTVKPTQQNSFSGSSPLKSGGVIRFAPTPNGPLHIGHGRGVSILSDYADRYNMEFILRFDDTDCSKKGSNLPSELNIPNVYEHIIEDFTWIRGKKPDKIIYASDRNNLKRYEGAGRMLISEGLAYVYFEVGPQDYIYGKSIEENLEMYNQIIGAGKNPPFVNAGVLLGIPNSMKTLFMLYENMSDSEVKGYIQAWVQDRVYNSKLSNKNILALQNTSDGTKIMRYQKDQNIRVSDRDEVQWLWPTLNLQSVVDDKAEGVTHVIRGLDYDYIKAIVSKDNEVLRTIRFQSIMRVLLSAPPVASTGNWGNVSWDGGFTLSTSKLRKMIMEGELGSQGFLHLNLPTIYALRADQVNWGQSFRFYWTRFNLPNAQSPTFKVLEFQRLNLQLRDSFQIEGHLQRHNLNLIQEITTLQNRGLYLAEDYRG